jgi:dimeric dUTPase (all-alpha-NTP-PPase superfamily)
MKNKLEKIFEKQKEFQYNFYNPDNMTEEDKIYFTKEYILCIHRELGEVLNLIPWKIHRRNKEEYNIDYLQEELIDCFKFLLNLCIIWNIKPDEFFNKFIEKSKIVENRYKTEIKNEQ